jgi:hypothetical protein
VLFLSDSGQWPNVDVYGDWSETRLRIGGASIILDLYMRQMQSLLVKSAFCLCMTIKYCYIFLLGFLGADLISPGGDAG